MGTRVSYPAAVKAKAISSTKRGGLLFLFLS